MKKNVLLAKKIDGHKILILRYNYFRTYENAKICWNENFQCFKKFCLFLNGISIMMSDEYLFNSKFSCLAFSQSVIW